MDDELGLIIGIVLLVLIGYHIYKVVKLHPLSPSDYPQMPAAKFNEWKKLELQSSYIFLISFFVYCFMVYLALQGNRSIIFLIILLLILPGGIIAAILEARNAGKIRKSFQVDWKRPVQKINTLPVAPSMELEFWQTIKDSKNPEDFKAYILTYPKGQFVELAKNRVREFRKSTITENRA